VIRIIRRIFNNLHGVAVSGGQDSMAALSFVRNANKNIVAYYFDHGTDHGAEAKTFIKDYCEKNNVSLVVGTISAEKSADQSWEEFWRIERYKFLHSFTSQNIATAHHLDDAAETYLWGCLHGNPRRIHCRQPGENGALTNIVRPFLLTPKKDLEEWCHRKQVPFIQDPSNFDTSYTRNRIRHNIMPEALKVNPGLLTVVRKQIEKDLLGQDES